MRSQRGFRQAIECLTLDLDTNGIRVLPRPSARLTR